MAQIDFQIKDNILVVRLTGDLDHHSAGAIRAQIDEAAEAFHATHLVLDFSKVKFMDSSGIGVVMGRYNKIKERNGAVYVTGCTGYVDRILDMAGIFTITIKEESPESAVDCIQGNVVEQMRMEVV